MATVTRSSTARARSERCCKCCSTGTCRRCQCVIKGSPCSSCIPSRSGRCVNSGRAATVVNHGDSDENQEKAEEGESDDGLRDRGQGSIGTRMMEAFGAEFSKDSEPNGLEIAGGQRDNTVWFQKWKRLVSIYSGGLPQGNVGRKFVGLLAEEVLMLTRKQVSSERVMVFCRVILQRDYEVKRGSDIRQTLKRRIAVWKTEQLDCLVQEAIQCARQLKSLSRQHVIKIM